jgi:hypothetical protein
MIFVNMPDAGAWTRLADVSTLECPLSGVQKLKLVHLLTHNNKHPALSIAPMTGTSSQ